MDKEQRIQEIGQEITKYGMIDAPAFVLIGVALYGKFGANGQAFHPLLDDASITTGMLVLGGAVSAWCVLRIITLAKERQSLQRS